MLTRHIHFIAAALLALAAVSNAQAQTTIDQNKALAGNITPGDAAGFPITLSLPGSYKLTSNLVVPAFTRGVLIQADGVTLDLNGFSISGPVTCNAAVSPPCSVPAGNTQHGVLSSGAATVIHSGSIRGFAGSGIVITEPGGGVVQDMLLANNSASGLAIESIGGPFSASGVRIVRTTAVQNGGSGFAVQGQPTAKFNFDTSIASANAMDGFFLGGGHGSVRNCVAEENHGYGLSADSFSLMSGSRFINNSFGDVNGAPNRVAATSQVRRSSKRGHGAAAPTSSCAHRAGLCAAHREPALVPTTARTARVFRA